MIDFQTDTLADWHTGQLFTKIFTTNFIFIKSDSSTDIYMYDFITFLSISLFFSKTFVAKFALESFNFLMNYRLFTCDSK